MTQAQTLLDKLWQQHEILSREDGTSLLWVDRHLIHEGSHHAFRQLAARNLPVARPDLTLGVVDHYAPTRRNGAKPSPQITSMIETLRTNAQAHGIECIDLDDPRQGIVHVVGPELGFTLPGSLLNCGDSHTSTHGAFGAMAFGVGATEVAHILATQTVWQKRPNSMRITLNGTLAPGVGAKDLALNWIAKLGADAARGHAVEYAGPVISDLSMEARMTLCNLTIEGGGRLGMIAPDETTFTYLHDRPFAPKGTAFEKALEDWRALTSDADARFDKEVAIEADEIAPIVTWGISPEDALPITATIPDPDRLPTDRADHTRTALDYMGLTPGRPLIGTPIDEIFIGSCTNARIEDLRLAAMVLRGRKSQVPGLVSPGSAQIKQQAEQEGLDQIFIDAGLEWSASGCSMCVGMNGDLVAPGKRCASSTNRNFRGRQGPGARTHLMSPAMVAASAVTGALADARPFLAERI